MEDINHVDELYEIAFGKFIFGTMAGIILFADGPANERIIPVQKTTVKIIRTFNCTFNPSWVKLIMANVMPHKK